MTVKITYDLRYNIAYISVREKTARVEMIRISDELNRDLAPDGSVYGIELLNANEELGTEPNGKLIVIIEEMGKCAEIDLPR